MPLFFAPGTMPRREIADLREHRHNLDWRERYAGALVDPFYDFEAIIDLKNEGLPLHLFKYREVTPENLDALERGYVWLSAPNAFKDPYDSATLVRGDGVLGDRPALIIAKYIEGQTPDKCLNETELRALEDSETPWRTMVELLAAHDPALSADVARVVGNVAQEIGDEVSDAIEKRVRDQFRTVVHACSFSETGESPPMWANYAANQAGYCVRYDTADFRLPDDIRRRLLVPIIYGSSAPFDGTAMMEAARKGPNDFSIRLPLAASSHKDSAWSFEKEWRFVHPLGGESSGMPVGMPTPSGICLGAAMCPKDRKWLLSVAKSRDIPVFRTLVGANAAQLQWEHERTTDPTD